MKKIQLSQRLANIISLIFHPFVCVFLGLLVVFVKEKASISSWAITIPLILMLGSIVPVVILWNQRGRGLASNIYITDKRQRAQFGILVALVLLPIMILALLTTSIPHALRLIVYFFIVNGLVYIALLRFVKISAHIGVITSVAIGLSLLYGISFIWLIALAVPVAWARYILRHHSPLELALGLIVSIISTLIIWTIPA
jgi:membrane-associated phospholipid phosphatase